MYFGKQSPFDWHWRKRIPLTPRSLSVLVFIFTLNFSHSEYSYKYWRRLFSHLHTTSDCVFVSVFSPPSFCCCCSVVNIHLHSAHMCFAHIHTLVSFGYTHVDRRCTQTSIPQHLAKWQSAGRLFTTDGTEFSRIRKWSMLHIIHAENCMRTKCSVATFSQCWSRQKRSLHIRVCYTYIII